MANYNVTKKNSKEIYQLRGDDKSNLNWVKT